MDYDMDERTPKRMKRDKSSSKGAKLKSKLEYGDDEPDNSEATTPRIRSKKGKGRAASAAVESPSVSNLELSENESDIEPEEEDLDSEEIEEIEENENDNDEDYEERPKKKGRKTPTSARKTKAATKRQIKENWTALQAFDNDVDCEDFIETTPWFRDRETETDEGTKVFYFCGLVVGKKCPAKAYTLIPAEEGKPVQIFGNGKEHVHNPSKRGIPEAVKREIGRIVQDGENFDLDDLMAKLAERKMPLPTKTQVKNFTLVKPKKTKIKLPGAKNKNERGDSSEAEETTSRKRKRRTSPRSAPKSLTSIQYEQ